MAFERGETLPCVFLPPQTYLFGTHRCGTINKIGEGNSFTDRVPGSKDSPLHHSRAINLREAVRMIHDDKPIR